MSKGWLGFVTGWRMYPRAHENRITPYEETFKPIRRKFMKAIITNFVALQILFLVLFAYIFGALYQQGGHVHNMKVLYIDYDGGAIGTSIRNAYSILRSTSYPTLIEHSASEYPTPRDIRHEVCQTRYWGAVFTSSGASARLFDAITTNSPYDKDQVLSYIWNEARYPALIDSTISSGLQSLSSTARIDYVSNNTFTNLTASSLPIIAEPWQLNSINIMPTTQGSRLIYNTLVIILILVQEFFYLGTINSLYDAFHIYARLNPHRIIFFRNLISLCYTFVGSLCVVAMIWAFRVDWHVNGNQFVLSWMVLWLFAHVNFLTLDVFTVWLPPPYIPMSLISWVILNVASIILPFELSPGFYKYGYVYPAHEVYQVLLDIWSRGCNPQLHYALPVLFALELSGLLISALGIHRRCHYATIKEENEKQAFQDRVDNALAFELGKREQDRVARTASVTQKSDSDEKKEEIERTEDEIERTEEDKQADVEKDRAELRKIISRADSRVKREQPLSGISFGPAFGFDLGHGEEERRE
ncbi:putative Nitrosoguanidine resistance protein SNG1 [Venturia nashicola]|nr:putative Nitrosoguanidine resistance protein SNG1 [Venturia nashicola]